MPDLSFGDPAALSKDFLYMSLLGLFLGAVLYAGCIFPALRRREFQSSGPWKRTGLILGPGLFLLCAFIGYWGASHRFTSLSFDSGRIALRYHWPNRTLPLACDEIKLIDYLQANARTGTMSLAIVLKDGRTLKSAAVGRWDFPPLLKEAKAKVCANGQ